MQISMQKSQKEKKILYKLCIYFKFFKIRVVSWNWQKYFLKGFFSIYFASLQFQHFALYMPQLRFTNFDHLICVRTKVQLCTSIIQKIRTKKRFNSHRCDTVPWLKFLRKFPPLFRPYFDSSVHMCVVLSNQSRNIDQFKCKQEDRDRILFVRLSLPFGWNLCTIFIDVKVITRQNQILFDRIDTNDAANIKLQMQSNSYIIGKTWYVILKWNELSVANIWCKVDKLA